MVHASLALWEENIQIFDLGFNVFFHKLYRFYDLYMEELQFLILRKTSVLRLSEQQILEISDTYCTIHVYIIT